MRRSRWVLVAGGCLLLACTVVVFLVFDHGSHSASDTLRPFVITMVPVWLAAGLAARWALSRRAEE